MQGKLISNLLFRHDDSIQIGWEKYFLDFFHAQNKFRLFILDIEKCCILFSKDDNFIFHTHRVDISMRCNLIYQNRNKKRYFIDLRLARYIVSWSAMHSDPCCKIPKKRWMWRYSIEREKKGKWSLVRKKKKTKRRTQNSVKKKRTRDWFMVDVRIEERDIPLVKRFNHLVVEQVWVRQQERKIKLSFVQSEMNNSSLQRTMVWSMFEGPSISHIFYAMNWSSFYSIYGRD